MTRFLFTLAIARAVVLDLAAGAVSTVAQLPRAGLPMILAAQLTPRARPAWLAPELAWPVDPAPDVRVSPALELRVSPALRRGRRLPGETRTTDRVKLKPSPRLP